MMKVTIRQTHNDYNVSLTGICHTHTYIHTHTHTIFIVIIGVDNPQFCYFIIKERCRSEDAGLKGFSPPRDSTNLCSSQSPFNGL